VVNIAYPTDDIEAVWAYVYISHSRTAKRSVAFVKFGDKDAQT